MSVSFSLTTRILAKHYRRHQSFDKHGSMRRMQGGGNSVKSPNIKREECSGNMSFITNSDLQTYNDEEMEDISSELKTRQSSQSTTDDAKPLHQADLEKNPIEQHKVTVLEERQFIVGSRLHKDCFTNINYQSTQEHNPATQTHQTNKTEKAIGNQIRSLSLSAPKFKLRKRRELRPKKMSVPGELKAKKVSLGNPKQFFTEIVGVWMVNDKHKSPYPYMQH